ncbi:MAG: ATPase, partial [Candidatus Omnitrophica bacterium CG11_big_fil_rev_8_21_14_0_20_43_6]
LFGLKGIPIVLAAIITAINTGFIFMFLEKKGLIEKNKNIVQVPLGYSIKNDFYQRAKSYKFNLNSLSRDIQGVAKGLVMLAQMVLGWILLGMLIASLAGAFIPTHFFHKFMSPNLSGLLVTLGLATVIEVCSEGTSPLAFEIYRQTGALGNSFVFLMAGVVTDYTEIGLLWSNVGRKVALWMPLVAVPQVLLLGLIFNLFLK